MQSQRRNNQDHGYTFVEIIAVIAVVGILAGAIIVVVTNGLGYASYARSWFNAQTKLTRVMQSMAFGSGSLPGVAGANDVEVLNEGKGLRIHFGAAEQISYTWDVPNKQIKKVSVTDPLLDHVTKFEVAKAAGGTVVQITIEVTLPPPHSRVLSSSQQVLIRNRVVTSP